ncbi:hypothetical protein ABZ896_05730 [Streptomyces sp. NPDC047072]|uniref:hypothetical protein n=1 Tax=Streptomyces sp. NPDC047072 TaxID=3154809 RepID=UPI0033C9AF41
MGTKTADETDAEKVDVTKTDEVTEAEETEATDQDTEDTEGTDETDDVVEAGDGNEAAGSAGVAQGAAAVVAAVLGFVSLSGSWVGTIASARQELVGQLHAQTATSSSVAKLLDEGYYDAWHATALWAGIFALLGLIVGVVVLVRPAFGAPGRPQAAWIKSVAWGGVVLGVIGLLLAVLKYTDLLLGTVSTS